MPIPANLREAVQAYRGGQVSLDRFEDLFRSHWRELFGESAEVRDVYLSIDNAFSELRAGLLTQQEFQEELANAIDPFAGASVAKNSSGERFPFPIPMSNADSFENRANAAA